MGESNPSKEANNPKRVPIKDGRRAEIRGRAGDGGAPVGQETEPLIVVRSTFLDPALEDGYSRRPNCRWMPRDAVAGWR